MGNVPLRGDLQPDVLEGRVARALEVARRRSGMTVDAIVRELRPALRLPEVSDRPIRWTWYDWRKKPRSIPAVALLAAAELANTTVDALLSETTRPSSEGRLARLERELAEQQRVIDQLRQAIDQSRADPPSVDQDQHRSGA